jgi:hypothetical protein
MPERTTVDRRARALCVELARVTGGRPMLWRMAQTMGDAIGIDEAAADVAIVYAVERDWLIADGNPLHSICLTDAGRVWTGRVAKGLPERKGPARDKIRSQQSSPSGSMTGAKRGECCSSGSATTVTENGRTGLPSALLNIDSEWLRTAC